MGDHPPANDGKGNKIILEFPYESAPQPFSQMPTGSAQPARFRQEFGSSSNTSQMPATAAIRPERRQLDDIQQSIQPRSTQEQPASGRGQLLASNPTASRSNQQERSNNNNAPTANPGFAPAALRNSGFFGNMSDDRNTMLARDSSGELGNGFPKRTRSLVRVGEVRTVERPKPMMRNENMAPPAARAGATSTRLGPIPSKDPPNRYTPPAPSQRETTGWWSFTAKVVTCCVWPICLSAAGQKDLAVRQAWREKVTLCLIIFAMSCGLGFMTFGLRPLLCPSTQTTSTSDAYFNQTDHLSKVYRDDVVINGYIYDFNDTAARLAYYSGGTIILDADWHGQDISRLFKPFNSSNACNAFAMVDTSSCTIPNPWSLSSPSLGPVINGFCPDVTWLGRPKSYVWFAWDEVLKNVAAPHALTVYNSRVLNLTAYYANDTAHRFVEAYSTATHQLNSSLGRDGTYLLSANPNSKAAIACLTQLYTVGFIDSESLGCVSADVIQGIMLAAILTVILCKFIMAITYHWCVSWRLVRQNVVRSYYRDDYRDVPDLASQWAFDANKAAGLGQPSLAPYAPSDDFYTFLMVTCYSEGEAGIRGTLDSLALTHYPDDKKLLFIVADGLITGSGNDRPTPDIIVDMMTRGGPGLEDLGGDPEPKSYLAIADGAKQHNMAKVYAGHYIVRTHVVPMIVVVKCGPPNEAKIKKPGNRGKRDSQLVLMNFVSRVMFNDRMTPLDYDMFIKIARITGGVSPDRYELVLMVDADTIVRPDSLAHMVAAMRNDDRIMGLCGETRIANKRASWVSAIQVYEYYISHHMGKAFEALFGGVTCLPGCFCMYRIKARKGPGGRWVVPVLANPDIVDEYSENVVDTLHKKNLLLLGEDRFLSTLMLRMFPRRKMTFVPQAVCRTVCPDEFSVLLSQRRRWINSTIHNLLELVRVRDLCGTFCFSMQFVVALDLIGTCVLPAGLLFTVYMIVQAIFTRSLGLLPLAILILTTSLPGILIVITTRKMVYVLWMFAYLIALPVWNFILPLYAFWRFDDFSWGETRKVAGEGVSAEDHSTREGVFEINSVSLKRFAEWEVEYGRLPAPKKTDTALFGGTTAVPMFPKAVAVRSAGGVGGTGAGLAEAAEPDAVVVVRNPSPDRNGGRKPSPQRNVEVARNPSPQRNVETVRNPSPQRNVVVEAARNPSPRRNVDESVHIPSPQRFVEEERRALEATEKKLDSERRDLERRDREREEKKARRERENSKKEGDRETRRDKERQESSSRRRDKDSGTSSSRHREDTTTKEKRDRSATNNERSKKEPSAVSASKETREETRERRRQRHDEKEARKREREYRDAYPSKAKGDDVVPILRKSEEDQDRRKALSAGKSTSNQPAPPSLPPKDTTNNRVAFASDKRRIVEESEDDDDDDDLDVKPTAAVSARRLEESPTRAFVAAPPRGESFTASQRMGDSPPRPINVAADGGGSVRMAGPRPPPF
ncbi:chitin synthase [Synchytrium microbalum]|uniref:chitin synthase n=1 Tax=Synchytrium microbalum TaxID=1806994 RepID=A0A507C4S8_9FUNG|nr:chitin synthase [Synchytrium microbalum]TPX36550.1 chitin synthase [Synchytrium microbalum]